MHDRILSEAMTAYVGLPGRVEAVGPEERVAVRIGEVAAIAVLPKLRAILDAMDDTDPPLYNVGAEWELGESASGWLRVNHPELSSEAIRAVANHFAFNWR